MQKKITIIYQDKWSGRVSRLFLIENNDVNDHLKNKKSYLVDCDEDSYLFLDQYPPDPEVRRVVSPSEINFSENLIPVVVIDENLTILMQAFTDVEGLNKTFETGFAHYFSRSRNQLWKKGEKSGHIQKVQLVEYSDLNKYIIYRVTQEKAA
ncbi:MAG: phosphoribosyl-AMP cyclohydrolase, partial [Leptospiraceae bacterium]|nr:phosphoribosyl-AMP cyclohydrolase [Leptospiraceae bacterium]